MPSGNIEDLEFSSRRADSQALAPTTKALALIRLFAPRGFVDVRNRFCSSIFANNDFSRHRSRDQREASGFLRRRNHHLAGAEVRRADAAASTLRAVMAGRTPVVRLR